MNETHRTTPATEVPTFLTPEQAAAQLGITASWLREQARAGSIPHRRVGPRIRFTMDDLAHIVASTARGTASVLAGPIPTRRRAS